MKRLLHNYHEDTFITYKWPQCSKEGETFKKTIIQKMPPMLVLHLNQFKYAISDRKKQNFVDFPVEGLSLRAHMLSDKPSASHSLCAVSNHFGTLSGGHYTSYCRPSRGNVWYNCDDTSVRRLRTPVKTSAAYLLAIPVGDAIWDCTRSFPPPPTTILSGPYLWNRYSQRFQIECAAWSCGLILHCCLPSNSLHYFLFLFIFFFPPRFCSGHISGTVTRRDSKLSVVLGPAV